MFLLFWKTGRGGGGGERRKEAHAVLLCFLPIPPHPNPSQPTGKWADEIVEDAPWILTTKFLKEHKIDYVCHDDAPYGSAGEDDIYAPIKAAGMFCATERTEGISTTDLITRIIRQYDVFVRRNLERGKSRQEMNVSFLKEQEIKLVGFLKEMEQRAIDEARKEAPVLFAMASDFSRLFDKHGELRTRWRAKRREIADGVMHVVGAALSTGPSSDGEGGGEAGGAESAGSAGSGSGSGSAAAAAPRGRRASEDLGSFSDCKA